MNECESIRDSLDAFQDGCLGQSEHREIEAHLNRCEACREFLRDSKLIGRALRDIAEQQWIAPANLWSRILASHQAQADRASRPNSPRASRRWALAAVLVLTVGLSAVLLSPWGESPPGSPAAMALVNEFHTFVISRRDLDYRHDNPESIRQWFSDKVDFRVPLPIRPAGLQLSGGRLCNMLDQRVVSFMYQNRDSWVSLYILEPVASGRDPEANAEHLIQGYAYIKWVHNGLQYSLVGDIPIEHLRKIAERLSTRHPVFIPGPGLNFS